MEPVIIETFKKLGTYEQEQLAHNEPSCFNGDVCIKKYRIIIEEIQEPIEVIQKRIQDLWDANTNWHNHQPLKAAGKKYGLDLS